MTRDTNQRVTNRRKVLKTASLGSFGLAIGPQVLKAQREVSYEGVYYDTLTHKVGGSVHADIREIDGSTQAAVDIAGFEIPLTLTESEMASGGTKHTEILSDEQFREGETPLKVTFVDHPESNQHYSGTLTRPSNRYGKLGFFLVPRERFSRQEFLENWSPDQNWLDMPVSFSVPNEGIPTDTGAERLVELRKIWNDSNDRGV